VCGRAVVGSIGGPSRAVMAVPGSSGIIRGIRGIRDGIKDVRVTHTGRLGGRRAGVGVVPSANGDAVDVRRDVHHRITISAYKARGNRLLCPGRVRGLGSEAPAKQVDGIAPSSPHLSPFFTFSPLLPAPPLNPALNPALNLAFSQGEKGPDRSLLTQVLKPQAASWHTCGCLYINTPRRVIHQPSLSRKRI